MFRTLAVTSRQDLTHGLASAEHVVQFAPVLAGLLGKEAQAKAPCVRSLNFSSLHAHRSVITRRPSHIVRSHPDPLPHLAQSALAGLGLGELRVMYKWSRRRVGLNISDLQFLTERAVNKRIVVRLEFFYYLLDHLRLIHG